MFQTNYVYCEMPLQRYNHIMSFSAEGHLLHVNTQTLGVMAIDITVLNHAAETLYKMKLISGEHTLSLDALTDGEYSVRLVAGNNVSVHKISIQHH